MMQPTGHDDKRYTGVSGMVQTRRDVNGKVAIITGGGTETSIRIAAALGDAGARIVLVDENGERLARAQEHLFARGIEVMTIPADPAGRTAMRKAAKAVLDRFGKVHIVIANANQEIAGSLCDAGEREWDRALAVNLGGVIALVQEFLPILRQQGEGGHLIARVPLSAIVTGVSPGVEAVQASAVVAIMEALSAELRGTGITSSLIIDPGDAAEQAADSTDVGQRVLAGIAGRDLYIFAADVPAGTFNGYFDPLIAAMPADASGGAPQDGADPSAMFPVYAAVLQAKSAQATAGAQP